MARRQGDRRRRSRRRSPLRQRARRVHRRDTERGTYYEPIRVDARAVERGIQRRLGAALLIGAMIFAGAVGVILFDPPLFTLVILSGFGVGGLSALISLVLSARREELVHQLASEDAPALLPAAERPRLPTEQVATDGSI